MAEMPAHFDGKILVPFPPQSVLSQVSKSVDDKSRIWYRRQIEIPAAWAGRSVLLNFGAVNWETHVFLNGIEVGAHTGGYDGFSCDITESLKGGGPQELVVSAWNPIEGGQPHGKQALKPDGIFYTPTTGIWQTVWLEPVGQSYIDDLRLMPDVDHSQLKLTVNVKGAVEGQTVEAVALADGKEVGRTSGKPGEALTIAVPNPKLWWPASPFLYDLKITLTDKGRAAVPADSVESYFGMRKVSVGPDETGHARILLNNRPVFQNGFLDQGFWPEGVYTAPTDDALKYDLQMLKKFGYNMDRKHIKVEPDRWYYWADKLGVLVWQDMPAAVEMKFPPNSRSIPDREGNYESELRRMIRGRFNHPSVVMWILFNEGWGLPEKQRKNDREPAEASPVAKARELRMLNATRQEDPTRLIDAESGTGGGGNDHSEAMYDFGFGDVVDYHCYGHDGPIAESGPKGRAGIVGEYGWGLAPVGALRNRMQSSEGADISGCVVTQLTDVENEHNGALKYDRTGVRNVELDKDIPGGILRVLHEYGYHDYPGGPTTAP
jgi:beta-galactosidase/beta-glucuronidase